jgi:hypothetical protein
MKEPSLPADNASSSNHPGESDIHAERLTAAFLQGAAEALQSVGIEALYLPHPEVAPKGEGWVYFEPGERAEEHQCYVAGHNLAGSVFLHGVVNGADLMSQLGYAGTGIVRVDIQVTDEEGNTREARLQAEGIDGLLGQLGTFSSWLEMHADSGSARTSLFDASEQEETSDS